MPQAHSLLPYIICAHETGSYVYNKETLFERAFITLLNFILKTTKGSCYPKSCSESVSACDLCDTHVRGVVIMKRNNHINYRLIHLPFVPISATKGPHSIPISAPTRPQVL